jgi:hypothetical protein
LRQDDIGRRANLRARILTINSVGHERVVFRMAMPDVRLHREIDRSWIEILGARRTANPFRVHFTGVPGDVFGSIRGRAWVSPANLVREFHDVFGIALRPAVGIGDSPPLAHFSIIETLLFGTRQRLFGDQDALSFVPLSRTAEPQHDGAQ